MAGYGAYLSRELLDQAIYKKSKQLNQRFYRMEKADKGLKESAYFYAKAETGKTKPRFTTSLNKISKMSDEEAKETLLSLDKKLKSKSSTLRGIEEISNTRINNAIYVMMKQNGIDDIDPNEFRKFLMHNRGSGGKLLNQYLDSTQLIEDWLDKRKQGFTNREFISIYKKHLQDHSKPFDLADVEKSFKALKKTKAKKRKKK